MTAPALVATVTRALEAAGIVHMVTGSVAAAVHGHVRSTRDVDVVVHASEDQLRRLADVLDPAEWFFDLEAAFAARRRASLVNLVHHPTGWKVDLIFRKGRLFSREELERRVVVEVDGVGVPVATVEDVLVSKLEWARDGASARQIEDVAALLDANPGLDRARVEHWVRELGLEAQWRSAQDLARED